MIYLNRFDKPVAFYAYTSRVISPILKTGSRMDPFGLSDDEQEIIDYIESQFYKANILRRRNDYCSTSRDNKTVIEMTDGKHSIFVGRYDGYYWIGLDVSSDCDECRIDLSDISTEDWYNIK